MHCDTTAADHERPALHRPGSAGGWSQISAAGRHSRCTVTIDETRSAKHRANGAGRSLRLIRSPAVGASACNALHVTPLRATSDRVTSREPRQTSMKPIKKWMCATHHTPQATKPVSLSRPTCATARLRYVTFQRCTRLVLTARESRFRAPDRRHHAKVRDSGTPLDLPPEPA